MSIRLFSLGEVDTKETNDVRQILRDNEIDYYETSPGIRDLGLAAIGVKDNSQLVKAHKLIES